MTNQQTCPHCGAEINDMDTWGTFFSCGTALKETADGVTVYPSSKCYETQLAAKDAEIERLRGALDEYGDHSEKCKRKGEVCFCGFDAARGEVK